MCKSPATPLLHSVVLPLPAGVCAKKHTYLDTTLRIWRVQPAPPNKLAAYAQLHLLPAQQEVMHGDLPQRSNLVSVLHYTAVVHCPNSNGS